MHTVKPLDEPLLHDVFGKYQVVITLEEHSILGGLGGSVAEWMADQATLNARLVRIGASNEFLHETSSQPLARKHFGITVENIVKRTTEVINEN